MGDIKCRKRPAMDVVIRDGCKGGLSLGQLLALIIVLNSPLCMRRMLCFCLRVLVTRQLFVQVLICSTFDDYDDCAWWPSGHDFLRHHTLVLVFPITFSSFCIVFDANLLLCK